MKKFLLAVVLATLAAQVNARELNGVTLPPTQTVGKQTLIFNGAGLRTATVLNVKIYVAAFYAPKPMTTEADVYASQGPLRLDLTYVRGFGQEKVTEAWFWQFEQSVSANYPDYKKDRDQFVKLFGPIKKGGVITIEMEGNETRVLEDGVLKGTVTSKDFQKAFLTMWFGDKPVMPEMKKTLLAGK